jgi:hypothetical protein
MLAQDRVLVGDRFRCPEHVPDIRELGDNPQRLSFPTTADHDRQVVLHGPWGDAERIEVVASAGLARHLAAVEERPDGLDRFGEPVESLPEPGSEIEAERRVLVLEPRTADAEDRAPAADVIDRDQ